MKPQAAWLDKPVNTRYEVMPDGTVVEKDRRVKTMPHRDLYGPPNILAFGAVAYIWPERRNRYVVALKKETLYYAQANASYGCFHVLPTLAAAKMFVFASL